MDQVLPSKNKLSTPNAFASCSETLQCPVGLSFPLDSLLLALGSRATLFCLRALNCFHGLEGSSFRYTLALPLPSFQSLFRSHQRHPWPACSPLNLSVPVAGCTPSLSPSSIYLVLVCEATYSLAVYCLRPFLVAHKPHIIGL